jgi:hypothetical protein
MGAAYKAPLYLETGQKADGKIELTRLGETRAADPNLKGEKITIRSSNFYCYRMPDLTAQNEAYFEVIITTELLAEDGTRSKLPYTFKKKISVKDKTNSADIQNQPMAKHVPVGVDGINFGIRLSELDQIDPDKFGALKSFVDDNNIPHVIQQLAGTIIPGAGAINLKQVGEMLFKSVRLFDTLNDDDRIWIESPDLTLSESQFGLYAGTYAFVSERKKFTPPQSLWKASDGSLHVKEGDKFTAYVQSTYLTFQISKD